jgi:hypothetical protein
MHYLTIFNTFTHTFFLRLRGYAVTKRKFEAKFTDFCNRTCNQIENIKIFSLEFFSGFEICNQNTGVKELKMKMKKITIAFYRGLKMVTVRLQAEPEENKNGYKMVTKIETDIRKKERLSNSKLIINY